MKRKLILCSLMLCMASSSIHINAWPSWSNLWSRTSDLAKKTYSSIVKPIAPFATPIAMHLVLFTQCQSMNCKDRLKQHMLFFIYANLIALINTAIHESGHAIAATLINETNTSIEIDTSPRSWLLHFHKGRTSTLPGLIMTMINDYSRVRIEHLKQIFAAAMGPIFGLIGAYTMLRIYRRMEISAKKISPFEAFWLFPFSQSMVYNTVNLIPYFSPKNDGSVISSHIKGLKETYTLEKNKNPVADHVMKYFYGIDIPSSKSERE